jgi:hypothetical protein
MPKVVDNARLARMAELGMAAYEGGQKIAALPSSKDVVDQLRAIAMSLSAANAKQAEILGAQLAALAEVVKSLVERKETERADPEYEFEIVERDSHGRGKRMIARPMRGGDDA